MAGPTRHGTGHDGTVTAPQFEALLDLQAIDTAIDQVVHRRRTLPARAELVAIASERASLATRRAGAEAARNDVAGRQSRLEAELDATEQRSRDVSARLYGGEVSASRELQALAADIEALKRRSSDLEDEIIAVLEEREPLDAAVAAIEAQDAALSERSVSADSDLAAGEEVADEEAAGLAERRGPAVAAVPDEIVATYERLRARLGGIGAARLVGRHCDGCHLELPATELDQIRRQPDDALVFCDQCGRILVRP